MYTLPKFNIAPEKRWLEDYFPFGMVHFQGRTVKLPGCIYVILSLCTVVKGTHTSAIFGDLWTFCLDARMSLDLRIYDW